MDSQQKRWLQQNGMEGMQRWSRGSNSHLNVYILPAMEVIGYYRPAGPRVEHLQMFRWGIQSPVSLSAPCDEQNRCTTGRCRKHQPALPASRLKSVQRPTHPPPQPREGTGTSAVAASIRHVTELTASLKLSSRAPRSPGPQSQIISTIISHFVYTKAWNWQRGMEILHGNVAEGFWKKKCCCQRKMFATFAAH